MKDDFPGSLASVGAHRQGNHGSCVEVHDETTIVVRNLTTCSRRLPRSQLRHDWNLPTRTERYHAAVEVGPNSPFYPTPMVRRRDGVKAERPGVVETATSHFPTPPPPPPRLVSHLWWGGACPDVTRGIWWGLSVSQLPRPWRRRRRGRRPAAIAALVSNKSPVLRGGGAGQLRSSPFPTSPEWMCSADTLVTVSISREPARWSGSGPIETNGDNDDDIERGAEGHLHPGT